MNENQRDPTVSEIAKEMGEKEENVVFAPRRHPTRSRSLNRSNHDGGDTVYIMDQVGDDSTSEEKCWFGLALSEGLERLSEAASPEDHPDAVFGRPHPNGSGGGDRHQPGPGLPGWEKNALKQMQKFM